MDARFTRTLAVAAGCAAAVPLAAAAAWRRESRRLERTILDRAIADSTPFTYDRLAGVPEPVRLFLSRTLHEGQRMPTTARITQSGDFQLNGKWCAMRARQLFSAAPAGFVWDARIQASPLLPVFVRDSYVLGRASMKARLAAVYPLVNQSGSPALNAGALQRYLGELCWLPTRLLPCNGLSWTAIDGRAALATLSDGDTDVSLEFRFDDSGDVSELYAAERFREVDGAYVPTPWRVRALEYGIVDGARVMAASVAEWILPQGALPYWRGRITSVQYR